MNSGVGRLLTVSLLLAVVPGRAVSHTQEPSQRKGTDPNDPVWIHDGFLTAREFRDLPQARKNSYAAGVLDGALLAPLFGAPKERLEWLESCAVGMTDEQVAAIISRFIADNPARWHQHLHTQFYTAMREACPKK